MWNQFQTIKGTSHLPWIQEVNSARFCLHFPACFVLFINEWRASGLGTAISTEWCLWPDLIRFSFRYYVKLSQIIPLFLCMISAISVYFHSRLFGKCRIIQYIILSRAKLVGSQLIKVALSSLMLRPVSLIQMYCCHLWLWLWLCSICRFHKICLPLTSNLVCHGVLPVFPSCNLANDARIVFIKCL